MEVYSLAENMHYSKLNLEYTAFLHLPFETKLIISKFTINLLVLPEQPCGTSHLKSRYWRIYCNKAKINFQANDGS